MSYSERGRQGGGGSGFGGDRGFGAPKPVETGKEYDVQINETSRQGDGIARIQGFVIFVKNARAGQKVRIKVTHIGERFANAEVVSGDEKTQVAPAESKDSTSQVKGGSEPNLQDYKSDEKPSNE